MFRSALGAITAGVLLGVAACGGGGGGGGGGVTPPPTTGTVSGTVTASGSAVSGAQVALSGQGSQTTNAQGQFTFSGVPAGTHTLTLTLPSGYELASGETLQKSVSVTAGQTATVGWSLQQVSPPTAKVDTIRLSGTSFSPSSLNVKAGGTVVWVNESGVHTVTPDGHTQWQRADASGTGEVLRVTFNSTGSFDYYCEPHRSQGMTGRVVVQQ